jgi:radical SAM protein with 4Fe4S-binding SPASM domain
MAYAKYRVKETGVEFYVCNKTNNMFEADGTPLITPHTRPESYWVDMIDSEDLSNLDTTLPFAKLKKTRKKATNPIAMRITLGHACNYDCSYCIQKDIGNPDERPKNSSLEKFLNNLESHVGTRDLQRVELWGGEPFLYWNDIVPIMKKLDREGLTFYISTNGSTLHDKHVDFFNTLKSTVEIGISHDGPAQEECRGAEIFNIKRVQRIIKRIDDSFPKIHYGFNFVLTNRNFDLFKINDFFKDVIEQLDLHHAGFGFEIGQTFNTVLEVDHHYSLSEESVVSGENLPKFQKIFEEYLEAHRHQYTEYLQKQMNGDVDAYYGCRLPLIPTDIYTDLNDEACVLGYMDKTVYNKPIITSTQCGADDLRIISLDIEGNVRTCPHAAGEDHVYGNIQQLKGIRILSLDLKRDEGHCSKCSNLKICKSGCPISLPTQSFLKNCAMQKVYYHEIQKAAFNMMFNGHVEMLTDLYKGGVEELPQHVV